MLAVLSADQIIALAALAGLTIGALAFEAARLRFGGPAR